MLTLLLLQGIPTVTFQSNPSRNFIRMYVYGCLYASTATLQSLFALAGPSKSAPTRPSASSPLRSSPEAEADETSSLPSAKEATADEASAPTPSKSRKFPPSQPRASRQSSSVGLPEPYYPVNMRGATTLCLHACHSSECGKIDGMTIFMISSKRNICM